MNSLVKNIESAVKNAFEEFSQLISSKYNIELSELIELWNESCNSLQLTTKKEEKPVSKLSSLLKKKEATPVPSASTSESGGCKHIMIRGERKGQNCGAKTSKDSSYCTKHKKSDEEEKSVTKPIAKPIDKSPTPLSEDSGLIIARKNKDIDAFWHQKTGFVFKSGSDQQVIGKCVDKKVIPLSDDDIELCKSMNLSFKVEEKKEETMTAAIKKITAVPADLVKGAKDIKKSIHKITTSEEDSEPETKKSITKTITQNKKTETPAVKKDIKSVEEIINEMQESGPEDIEEEELLEEEDD